MIRFVAAKLGFFFLALWAALTFNYLIPRLMPGDPVGNAIARSEGRISEEAIEALRIQFGLDDSRTPLVKYVDYLWDTLRFDFGISISDAPVTVGEKIGLALPWSVSLVTTATLIAFLLGTGLGMLAAWNRGRPLDRWLVLSLTFVRAFPFFWIALLAQFIFAVELEWLPVGHGYDVYSVEQATGLAKLVDRMEHALLPALALVLGSVGSWLFLMRNAMMSTMNEEFITVARAKGLRERTIRWNYGARNAILPSVTDFAMTLGFMVAGTVITEIVFSYPGIGKLLLDSVYTQDYPLMQGIFFIIALSVLTANLLADLLYAWLDPRVRRG